MTFDQMLMAPLLFIFDPGKRIFFVYLLSSFLMAFVLIALEKRSLSASLKELLSARLWKHHSTQIDLSFLVFNTLLKSLLFLVVTLSSIVVAKSMVGGLNKLLPDYETLSLSASAILLSYSICSFVLLDFARFIQHYLFHKVPFLWRFHKLHHTAEIMTPLTLYRTHPVESVVSSFRRIFVVGLVSGAFIFTTGSVIDAYAIMGVSAFDFLFNLFGSNLRHSHVWLSFGPLNHIFVSPAQHQIHHSRNPKHFDKNLGFSLSVWDKMFGTFYQVQKKEFLIFGIRGHKIKTFWQALKSPL